MPFPSKVQRYGFCISFGICFLPFVAINLLMSGCARAPLTRKTGPTNSVSPAPERTPDEFTSRDFDRAAKNAGLLPLRTTNVAQADTEVRVWYWDNVSPLEGFAVKREKNQWTAFHLREDPNPKRRTAVRNLSAPKSGWELCWQRLVSAGVLVLPSGTEDRDPDVNGFYVELTNEGTYRNYIYWTPEYSDSPNAKRMLGIGDIISEEFGLKRFHVTKPVQSWAMPNKSLDRSHGRRLSHQA
jgi:hypothetical protein